MSTEPRSVEEAYCAATTTSNMKMRASDLPNSAADYVAAAGMSNSVAGACFIRLHGEWACVEKPIPPKPDAIRKLAESLTFDQLVKMRVDLKLTTIGNLKPSMVLAEIAAHAQARAWYIAEVEMLLGKLKSFRAALGYLVAFLGKWDNRPEPMLRQTAVEVLIWWLDKQCKSCNGTQWEVAAGSNRHSNRPCKACRGTGEAKFPREDDGRRLDNFLSDCCNKARTSIKERLRRD